MCFSNSVHSYPTVSYTHLDVYKRQGFGRVTVEYMCAGLAVIASDCGANPELIQHDVTGIRCV